MTLDERVEKVRGRGFTDRQARFLVMVMLHSGVCMVRQYCAFSRTARGQKTQDFFRTLVDLKYATVSTDQHRKCRLFHVQRRSLYEAIGEPDNRFRKPAPIGATVERLMLLDAVLASPGVSWMSTERDKLAYFTRLLGVGFRRADLPHLDFGGPGQITTRYFPDKMPIGLDQDDQTLVFCYLVRRSSPIEFRAFLQRHAMLFRALLRWRVRLLVPLHFEPDQKAYLAAFRQELTMPLRPSMADELRWYFERQAAALEAASIDPGRFARARRTFGSPRYRVLYRLWLREGPRVMEGATSPVLAEAVERGTARVECQALAHPYLHLSSLVGTA